MARLRIPDIRVSYRSTGDPLIDQIKERERFDLQQTEHNVRSAGVWLPSSRYSFMDGGLWADIAAWRGEDDRRAMSEVLGIFLPGRRCEACGQTSLEAELEPSIGATIARLTGWIGNR